MSEVNSSIHRIERTADTEQQQQNVQPTTEHSQTNDRIPPLANHLVAPQDNKPQPGSEKIKPRGAIEDGLSSLSGQLVSQIAKFNTSNTESEPTSPEPETTHHLYTRQEKYDIRYTNRSKVVNISNSLDISKLETDRCEMDSLLEESICILLDTHHIRQINKTALHELTNLAYRYMDNVFEKLHKLTEIQRRGQPSKMDIRLLSKERMFSFGDMFEEGQITKNVTKENKSKIRVIDKQALNLKRILDKPAEDDIMTETDPAFVFFNDISALLSEVVPPSATTKPYIPNWMPPLPPDHTYKCTPEFSQALKDPRKLKEKLVAEGRLGEKALHHIMDLRENVISIDSVDSDPAAESQENDNSESESEPEVEEEKEKEKEDAGIVATVDKGPLKNETLNATLSTHADNTNLLINQIPHVTDSEQGPIKQEPDSPVIKKEEHKGFDIVAFAKKRMEILEKRKLDEEKRFKDRLESDEAKLGRNLGFYTKAEKLPPNYNDYLTGFYDSKYNEITAGLRLQQKRRLKSIEKLERKRQKMEAKQAKEQQPDHFEFNDFEEDLDFDMDDVEFDDIEKDSNTNKSTKTQAEVERNHEIVEEQVVQDTESTNITAKEPQTTDSIDDTATFELPATEDSTVETKCESVKVPPEEKNEPEMVTRSEDKQRVSFKLNMKQTIEPITLTRVEEGVVTEGDENGTTNGNETANDSGKHEAREQGEGDNYIEDFDIDFEDIE